MKAEPMGGRLVAPESPVGELDVVDLKKFVFFPFFFYHYQIYAMMEANSLLHYQFS